MEHEPTLLTSAEVAAMFRISRENLEIRRHRGSAPPHVRIGRRIYYKPADVSAWIDGLPVEDPAERARAGA